MSMTTWTVCAAILVAVAASPLARRSAYGRPYPTALRVVVGVALAALGAAFPASSGYWISGIMLMGLAGMTPIAADGLLDVVADARTSRSGGTCETGDDGMAAAAITAASLAAMSSTTTF